MPNTRTRNATALARLDAKVRAASPKGAHADALTGAGVKRARSSSTRSERIASSDIAKTAAATASKRGKVGAPVACGRAVPVNVLFAWTSSETVDPTTDIPAKRLRSERKQLPPSSSATVPLQPSAGGVAKRTFSHLTTENSDDDAEDANATDDDNMRPSRGGGLRRATVLPALQTPPRPAHKRQRQSWPTPPPTSSGSPCHNLGDDSAMPAPLSARSRQISSAERKARDQLVRQTGEIRCFGLEPRRPASSSDEEAEDGKRSQRTRVVSDVTPTVPASQSQPPSPRKKPKLHVSPPLPSSSTETASGVSLVDCSSSTTATTTADATAEHLRRSIDRLLVFQRSLHSGERLAASGKLERRDKETAHVRTFLEESLQRRQGDALYICGAPGTGKTVSVSHVLSQLFPSASWAAEKSPKARGRSPNASPTSQARLIQINAMKYSDAKVFFQELYAQLNAVNAAAAVRSDVTTFPSITAAAEACQNLISQSKRMIVLSIDEIDSLLSQAPAFSQTVDGASGVFAEVSPNSAKRPPAKRNHHLAFDEDNGVPDTKQSRLPLTTLNGDRRQAQHKIGKAPASQKAFSSHSADALYRLFSWPQQHGSRLVLIGIANSIDLLDRWLPRLKQAFPTLRDPLVFAPYGPADLAAIVRQRLDDTAQSCSPSVSSTAAVPEATAPAKPAESGTKEVMAPLRKTTAGGAANIVLPKASNFAYRSTTSAAPPTAAPTGVSRPATVAKKAPQLAGGLIELAAIDLCAKKVAASSGDVRRCLDLCRQSVDDLLAQYWNKLELHLSSQADSSSPDCSSSSLDRGSSNSSANHRSGVTAAVDTAPAIVTFSLMHVTLGRAMHSRSKTVTQLKGLTTHQAILLCVCARGHKAGAFGAAPTVKEVEAYYRAVAQRQHLPRLQYTEFSDTLLSLVSCGLIERTNGRSKKGNGSGTPSPTHGSSTSSSSSADGIVVKVQWDDLQFAFADQDLFRQLLDLQIADK